MSSPIRSAIRSRITRFAAASTFAALLALPACASAAWTPGTPDTAYGGGDGLASVTLDGGAALQASDGVVDSSGRQYIAGSCGADACVARLTAAGALDTSYGGGDGLARYDWGMTEYALGIVLDSSGRAVIGGLIQPAGTDAMLIARFNAAGTALDTTFGGGDGYEYLDSGAGDQANAIAMAPNGKFVIGGYIDTGGANLRDFAVAYFNSNGTIDTTNGSGFAVFNAASDDEITDLVYGSDGRVTAIGDAASGLTTIWRIGTDGLNDATFGGGDGVAALDVVTTQTENPSSLKIDGDGRIVVGGTHAANGGTPMVARIKADGSGVDTTFGGGDGYSTFAATSIDDGVMDVTLGAFDRILVAGYNNAGMGDIALFAARLKSNGGLDTTFGGGDGVFTTNPSLWHMGVSIDELEDGRMLIGGSLSSTNQPLAWKLRGDQADLAVAITKPKKKMRRRTRNKVLFKVTNRGGQTARDVTLRGTLPARMKFRSMRATGGMSCTRSGRRISCTLDSLAAGSTATLTLQATPKRSAKRRAKFIWKVLDSGTLDLVSSNNSKTKTVRVRG